MKPSYVIITLRLPTAPLDYLHIYNAYLWDTIVENRSFEVHWLVPEVLERTCSVLRLRLFDRVTNNPISNTCVDIIVTKLDETATKDIKVIKVLRKCGGPIPEIAASELGHGFKWICMPDLTRIYIRTIPSGNEDVDYVLVSTVIHLIQNPPAPR